MDLLKKIHEKNLKDVKKVMNSEIVLHYTTLKLLRASMIVVLGLVMMAMGTKILQEVEVTSILDIYVSLVYFTCSFFYLLYSTIALGVSVIFAKAFFLDEQVENELEGSKTEKIVLLFTYLSLCFMYTILSKCVIVGTSYWF